MLERPTFRSETAFPDGVLRFPWQTFLGPVSLTFPGVTVIPIRGPKRILAPGGLSPNDDARWSDLSWTTLNKANFDVSPHPARNAPFTSSPHLDSGTIREAAYEVDEWQSASPCFVQHRAEKSSTTACAPPRMHFSAQLLAPGTAPTGRNFRADRRE